MSTVIVRYKVKAGRVDENRAFIDKVFDTLKAEQPDGFRYASFQGPDEQSFTHVASVDGDGNENPLPNLQAFKNFTAEIKDRCDEPPEAVQLTLVRNYRLVAD